MKKKLFTLSMLSLLALSLGACGTSNKDSGAGNEDIRAIYELYQANGGTQTYEEWLASIKGDKGDKGEKGDTGAQGPKGDKGDKGDAGAAGTNGQDGAPGAKGDKGEKGDTGAQGPKGDKGDTGRVGFVVSNETDLRAAVTVDNSYIVLSDDIELTNDFYPEKTSLVLTGKSISYNTGAHSFSQPAYPFWIDGNADKMLDFTLKDIEINVQGSSLMYGLGFDHFNLELNNVTLNINGGTGLGLQGGRTVLNNVSITHTGAHTAEWRNTCIGTSMSGLSGVQEYACVELNDCNFVSNHYVIYTFSSGGDVVVNSGTYDGKICANHSATSYPQYSSTITINGGTFNNCTLSTVGDGRIIVKGGAFDCDPTNYVDLDNYNVVEDSGTWTVTAKNV